MHDGTTQTFALKDQPGKVQVDSYSDLVSTCEDEKNYACCNGRPFSYLLLSMLTLLDSSKNQERKLEKSQTTMNFVEQQHSAFRSLQSSGGIWDAINFNSDAAYNLPAPEPWVAFLIGGVSRERYLH